jgi:hypothetical protein
LAGEALLIQNAAPGRVTSTMSIHITILGACLNINPSLFSCQNTLEISLTKNWLTKACIAWRVMTTLSGMVFQGQMRFKQLRAPIPHKCQTRNSIFTNDLLSDQPNSFNGGKPNFSSPKIYFLDLVSSTMGIE